MRPFEPILWDDLPDSAKQILPADAAPSMRMMASRLLLPMGTRDLASILFFLASDEDRRVRYQARRSLSELPPDLLRSVLMEEIHPHILHWFANRQLEEKHYELIALNPGTLDETIAYLVSQLDSDRLMNIIASNQKRVLNSPAIMVALMTKPKLSLEIRERVRQYVESLSGRSIDEILAEHVSRLEKSETETPLAEAEEVPQEPAEEEPKKPKSKLLEMLDSLPENEVPPELDMNKVIAELYNEEEDFSAEFMIDPEEDLTANARMSLANRVRSMTVLDKMRLGLKGNIEARQILIKSSNKMIQECVLKNARITPEEIIRVAKDKTMREELIRFVASNKEWIKNYEIMHQLCWNPKTPITVAMKFIERLNLKDVQSLAKSKQVPGMLAVAARKVVEVKQKYR
ncbi:MAG TPA: HEAT repeat domain-containing protein [bacterium]|nr:HEAT repeat domain-containing protein [bacterium]